MENKGYDEGLLTLEDWTLTWSYEEEWSWFKVEYECGWYSYWETMHGDSWAPRDDNKKAVWNNDLWKFKGNFIPKPSKKSIMFQSINVVVVVVCLSVVCVCLREMSLGRNALLQTTIFSCCYI
ncbi:hypothetical protein CRYUN_Cryun22dG0072700 [Craigia yunnanensis]